MTHLQRKDLFIEAGLINGVWTHAKTSIDVLNPADGTLIGRVPDLGLEETQNAINAASRAFIEWSNFTGKKRSQLLRAWFDLILQNRDDFARLMTLECGKPLTESYVEVDYGANFIEWAAEEAKRIEGDILLPANSDQQILAYKFPVGVVAAITPWNFPLAMITRKCAPALAAGCTLVLKPSELTPFTALAAAKLAEEAGIPKGVINIVTGQAGPVGKALLNDFRVRKISFTGSTRTGQYLMQESAATLKRLSLELGGNAPFIIFEDADLDKMIDGLLKSKFRNSGQTCVCPNRVLVDEKILPQVLKKITDLLSHLKVGSGFDEGVQVGPLINEKGLIKVKGLVEEAVNAGAKIIVGGKPHSLGGNFFTPTLLTDVTPDMRIFKEEIFGPVISIITFKTVDEALEIANDTIYGLAAYVFTNDYHLIMQLGRKLNYGMVGVNTGIMSSEIIPFGGVKASGFGREGSHYGIDEFLELRSVCVTS